MAKKDVTHLIERVEAFEERAGVRFEALSARKVRDEDDGEVRLEVLGEIHSRNGDSRRGNVTIVLAIYDAASRVVELAETYISQETFFGFETFQAVCYDLPRGEITKLRLIPKLAS